MNHLRQKYKRAQSTGVVPRLQSRLVSASMLIVTATAACACTRPRDQPLQTRSPPNATPPPSPQPDAARAPNVVMPSFSSWCAPYQPAARIGSVSSPRLNEISGLAASARHDGVIWVHNDSGDAPQLYAIHLTGKLLSRHPLPRGTSARDWEDMARLPRPNQADYLFIADTGDNRHLRKEGLFVHRLAEPEVVGRLGADANSPRVLPIQKVNTMHIELPDGPRDIEALLVDPWTGQLVLFSKSLLGWPEVLVAAEFGERAQLTKTFDLTPRSSMEAIQLVTGADISSDGHWLALRTYNGVYLFHRARGQSISDALTGRACPLPDPRELQGEAVGILPQPGESGAARLPESSYESPSLLTISEGLPAALSLLTPDR